MGYRNAVLPAVVLFLFPLNPAAGRDLVSGRLVVGATAEIFLPNLSQGIVGLTFDGAGNMYIATHGASAAERGKVGLKDVVRVDRDGKMSVVATYRCFAFQYLEFGRDGYIYASVANPNGQSEVLKISRDGEITVLCTGFVQPAAIVFDPAGTPFVLDAQENRVYRIDGQNQRTVFIDIAASAQLGGRRFYFHGMKYDSSFTNLYVVGLAEGTGKVLRYPVSAAGSPGAPVLIAESHNPMHVTTDRLGNAFATVNHRSILYIRQDDTATELPCDGAAFDGAALAMGGPGFDENSLYVNAFDKVVRISLTREPPLDAAVLTFPRLVNTAGEAFGVALVNSGEKDATLSFTAYDDDGKPAAIAEPGRNPAMLLLKPGQQYSAVGAQIFGQAFDTAGGWMRITSDEKNVAGCFLTFDPDLNTMDGTDVGNDSLTGLLFPEIADTEISLVNTSPNVEAGISIALYGNDGISMDTPARVTIPAMGRFAAAVSDLFPNADLVKGGYASVTASAGVSGMQVNSVRDTYTWALRAIDATAGALALYSPQFVLGFGYRSSLILVNLESLPATVSLKWISDDGMVLGSAASVTIPAAGRTVISDSSVLGAAVPNSGYVKVESDRRLAGAVFFGDEAGRQIKTALPLVSVAYTDMLFSQVAQNETYYTGLAVLNPGTSEANVAVMVYDEKGALQGTGSERLGPGCRFSKLLTQITGRLPSMSKGYFRVRSDQPVSGFAVFGTQNFSVLSAIPANPLPR